MTDLKVSEADFFKVRDNFITFAKSNPAFTDYDFSGSALSVLNDTLAYVTHYNAVHTNFALGESFLDSAEKRSSITSRAKELGYTPRSTSAAHARIQLSFNVSGNPSQYTVPKGTRFTSNTAGETYYFTTIKDTLVNRQTGNTYIIDLDVYEGQFVSYSYTVNLNNPKTRYVIPAKNVDTRFLTVNIKDTAASEVTNEYTYIKELNIGSLTGDTLVYFLQESYDEFYEVYFGDGVVGNSVKNNNVINLNYIISSGDKANGIKKFNLVSTLIDTSNITIATVSGSSGGADRETKESIKYLAPFYYQSQDRAVTSVDYKAIMLNNYPNIEDIHVWGGETNDPPYYGKVFAAIKPRGSDVLSNTTKEIIKNDLTNRFSVLTIRPEIVDPDYIDVTVDTVVTYNARLFNNTTSTDLGNSIKDAIALFFSTNALKFTKSVYYSKLVKTIDNSSQLVLNSVTNLSLKKSRTIYTGVSSTYTYEFNNAIHPGSLVSNEFIVDGVTYKLRDIPGGPGPHNLGTVAIYKKSNTGSITYLTKNAGSVDYNSGKVIVSNTKIDSIVGDSIRKLLKITISPGAFANMENPQSVYTDYNVYTNDRDQLIRLEESNVILIPDESV